MDHWKTENTPSLSLLSVASSFFLVNVYGCVPQFAYFIESGYIKSTDALVLEITLLVDGQ